MIDTFSVWLLIGNLIHQDAGTCQSYWLKRASGLFFPSLFFKKCEMISFDTYSLPLLLCFCLSVRGSRPGKNVQLTENEIRGLCLKSREIFLSQPILLELEAPLKICGDIHGQGGKSWWRVHKSPAVSWLCCFCTFSNIFANWFWVTGFDINLIRLHSDDTPIMVYNGHLITATLETRLFWDNLMTMSRLLRMAVKFYLVKCLKFKVKLNGHLQISGQD